MSMRTYIRRSKRVATTPLEDILEEEDEYSGGISGNEEQAFVSGDVAIETEEEFVSADDATGTEKGFTSGDNANGRESGTLNSEVPWEYKRPKMQNVHPIIQMNFKEKIITQIENKLKELGEEKFKKFKKGPFRSLLKLPRSVNRCNPAIHYFISREMKPVGEDTYDEKEISYFINNTRVRFTRFEYALITGLRFGKSDFDPNTEYIVEDSFMWRRLFKGQKSIKVQSVLDKFLGVGGKTLGDDPEDYVKAAKIIFVYSFLFGQVLARAVVADWIWVLVEFPKAWNNFPWGSASYQMLLKYLTNVKKEPAGGEREGYHLGGFVYAFMAWIYCAFPKVSDKCGERKPDDHAIVPRILRFTYEKFNPNFRPNFTQVFEPLSPNEGESVSKYWLSLEPEGTRKFYLNIKVDRSGALGRSHNIESQEQEQAHDQTGNALPTDQHHPSSSHGHASHRSYGPEDPIFSFAWSQRESLIDEIGRKTYSILCDDKEALEQIGKYAASQAVKEVMKSVHGIKKYMEDLATSNNMNEQDKRMDDDIVDYSILPYHIFREKVGPTPQYNCTPSKPSVFHDPNLSEDQYPSKLQFREVKMQAEFLTLSSPFRPYERRGIDYNKFLRSTGLKRNVGIGIPVNLTFFKDIVDTKKRLENHHIDAYIACLHTAPEFAGLDTWNAKATLTSPAFLVSI